MSTNHTPNFNLCQWEADDKVLRSDFNADNQKIDAALAGLQQSMGNCRIAAGSYVGTGKSGSANPCVLTFDFQPQLVILNTQELDSYNEIAKYYLLFPGVDSFPVPDSSKRNSLTWSETGISWYYESSSSSESQSKRAACQYNTQGKTYSYLVFG